MLSQAARTVRLENAQVVIDHAYVQRGVTPLDIYLHEADRPSAEAAVIEYGNAIKDLAVSNIFPADLKKVFLDHHAELFDVAFWQQAQLRIRSGETPFLFPYAPQYRLP